MGEPHHELYLVLTQSNRNPYLVNSKLLMKIDYTTEKQRHFNHAALTYLNLWATTDRHLIDEIMSTSSEINGEAMHRLAIKYKVVRGISSKDEEENPLTKQAKQKQWQSIADLVSKHAKMKSADPLVVGKLAHILSCNYGSKENQLLISAATKFLWFAGRHSIKIYDSRALGALLPHGEGKPDEKTIYPWFEKTWAEHISQWNTELRTAIKGLERQLAWSAVPAALLQDAKVEIHKPWFSDRVFDQYLWAKGNPGKNMTDAENAEA